MSETKIKDLRINKGLTKQQLIDSTTITENELSFVTDNSVVDVPAPTEAGKVLTSTEDGVEWAEGGSGGISDVIVNGVSVVSGSVAAITMPTIDDTSTTSTTATWSASKLNTTIGNIESLLAAI